jgi:hypothetical protein
MKKIILFLFVIASFISCKKNEAASGADDSITVGSVLNYKIKIYATTGNVYQTYDYSQKYLREEVISGNTWYVVEATITGLGKDTGYLRKASDGLHILENNVSQLYLKSPAAVNDTWTVTIAPGNSDTYVLKGVNQSITVPIGTVSCFYAESRDTSGNIAKKWYSDTYSLVKMENYYETIPGTPILQSTLELVSYTP